jgi:hypothetical protein
VSEVFAAVRLSNTRGVATAQRVGMEWVGVTDKYYGLTLQIYRLTAADLDYVPYPARSPSDTGPPGTAPAPLPGGVREEPHRDHTGER